MPSATSADQEPLSLPLRAFLYTLIGLTFVCGLAEFVFGALLHRPNPYNWPLTQYSDFHKDLNDAYDQFQRFHTLAFFDVKPWLAYSYPAPVALIYRLFYLLPQSLRSDVFLAVMIAFVFGSAWAVARAAIRRGLRPQAAYVFCAVTVLLAYPFAFDAKQGNMELFVTIFIAAGVWLFHRGKGYSAAACFALAGSMKIYPFIFLGLHLSRRRWAQVAFGIAVGVATTLFALWMIAPDIAYSNQHLQANIQYFVKLGLVENLFSVALGFDHSLFGIVRRLFGHFSEHGDVALALRIYTYICLLAGAVIYFARIRVLPFTNQVLALTICAITFPPVSFDYTLTQLYIPLTLLVLLAVDAERTRQQISGLDVALVLLAIAIAPLSEIIEHDHRFGGQVRALVLCSLLVVVLRHPLQLRDSEPVTTLDEHLTGLRAAPTS